MNLRKVIVIGTVAALELSAVALMVSIRWPGKANVSAAPIPAPPSVTSVRQEAPPMEVPVVVTPPPPPPVPVEQRLRIPVLMYHEIIPGPNSLYVPEEEFAGHLQWLKENGYTAITLQQLYDYYTDGKPVPPKPVVLTFDDGYTSYYEHALPQLKRFGWPGTLFVITGAVGQRGYMTWDQIRDAARQGTEVGAHTVNHLSLDLQTGERLVHEVADSRKDLQRETGLAISFFCYPAGKWNQETLRVAREAGFLGAVTTKPGLAAPDQERLLWDRIRINKGLSPKGLGSLLQSFGN